MFYWPYRRLIAWRTREMVRKAKRLGKEYHVDDPAPILTNLTEELLGKAAENVAQDEPSDTSPSEFLSRVESIDNYIHRPSGDTTLCLMASFSLCIIWLLPLMLLSHVEFGARSVLPRTE